MCSIGFKFLNYTIPQTRPFVALKVTSTAVVVQKFHSCRAESQNLQGEPPHFLSTSRELKHKSGLGWNKIAGVGRPLLSGVMLGTVFSNNGFSKTLHSSKVLVQCPLPQQQTFPALRETGDPV